MSEENKYILQVKDLHTSFATDAGEVRAVNGVSFNLEPGKTLGIVGESGSGKSVTSYSIMQILAETGKITGGEVLYHGEDISKWNEKQMQKFRGEKCSIIFQDPMTSLNPVFTIGNQLMEAILLHTDKDKKQARERAIEMLTLVGVNEPESRLKQYPHELSGGMRQRVMIAMALVCEPDILIADEPTTALDVTIQAQILELLEDMLRKFLFSHEGVPRQQAYQEKRHSFQHQQDQKPLPQAFQNHPGQGAASFPCSRASSRLISSNKWLSRSRGCHPRTSGLFK